MDEARFTMRIHPIVMQKMKQIAKNNGRSLNKEIEQILKWVVEDYERKYGRLEVDTSLGNFDTSKVKPLEEPAMANVFEAAK